MAKPKLSLNPKQRAFCLQYLVDFNATQSAIRAGYSKKTAYSIGWELLKKPEIQDFINKTKERTSNKLEITRERTMREIGRIAFQDSKQFFDSEGNILPIHEMSDDAAACIAGFEVEELFDNLMSKIKVRTGTLKKLRRYDKTKALEMLAKHFNIFSDAPVNNNTITVGYGKE